MKRKVKKNIYCEINVCFQNLLTQVLGMVRMFIPFLVFSINTDQMNAK